MYVCILSGVGYYKDRKNDVERGKLWKRLEMGREGKGRGEGLSLSFLLKPKKDGIMFRKEGTIMI